MHHLARSPTVLAAVSHSAHSSPITKSAVIGFASTDGPCQFEHPRPIGLLDQRPVPAGQSASDANSRTTRLVSRRAWLTVGFALE